MEKKKVLLIAETMEGGVRRHVMDLINGLDTDRFTLTLVYGNRVDAPFSKNMNKLKEKAVLIHLPSLTREINIKEDMRALTTLKKIIKLNNPDIVHCHSSKAGVVGRLAAKSSGVRKVFYTPHAYSFQNDSFSQSKKRLFITIERLLSRRSTTYTFNVSQQERSEAIRRKIDRENKFKVVYNGIPMVDLPDKYQLKTELGLTPDTYIIGNNGRLSYQKDPLRFLMIADKVISRNSNIHFVWAGDGPLNDECREYIRAHQLEDNVHLLGFRDDAELIVSAYDLFLITSRHEGLPYSLIEAMRASVPIIGFRDSGIDEIVTEENGVMVDGVEQAEAAILQYVENMTFSKDIIYSNFQHYYSIDKMLKDLQSVYVS
ncbi:glycosyltransferase [Alkalibacterium pelagium]|uniref:Glycosyltransferase involved in cell wall bisynthesis n=1 Tax=Alkalibacterium pelagium TaxID=426702 RepID=A0A1H7HPP5_9LACT|nr:glycosyltransferase [Alkalibacterium pelagium]GEN50384.1 glycosyl transferase [Alkalibacterium pelagium]SEK52239.1 Glycosyltransferase involved in cell wall bisynthesis [Alkalibacterium pelagium]